MAAVARSAMAALLLAGVSCSSGPGGAAAGLVRIAPERVVGWFLTPDQQGRAWFEAGDPERAAPRFRDSLWKGLAHEAAGDLIQCNCTFSIMQAVAEHPSLVSRTYYRALEQCSPLRFRYLRGLRRRLEKRSRRLEKMLPRGGIMAACWQQS